MGKTYHFKSFSVKRHGVSVDIDMSRIERNINKAQFVLDKAIMTSMVPYMPMDSGQFINITKGMSAAIAGTGKVVAAAPPYGRFLYEGKTLVDPKTGSPWARKGAKKVLVSAFQGKTNAAPNLTYSKGRTDHWFEKARDKDGDNWEKLVQKEISKP